MLQWLHDHQHDGEQPQLDIGDAVRNAIYYGFTDAAKFVYNHDERFYGISAIDGMNYAAELSELEMVRWLYPKVVTSKVFLSSNGFHNRLGLADRVVPVHEGAHLRIVQWLDEHRSEELTWLAIQKVLQRPSLALVRWLHEHRKMELLSMYAMDGAAANGKLDAVQ